MVSRSNRSVLYLDASLYSSRRLPEIEREIEERRAFVDVDRFRKRTIHLVGRLCAGEELKRDLKQRIPAALAIGV